MEVSSREKWRTNNIHHSKRLQLLRDEDEEGLCWLSEQPIEMHSRTWAATVVVANTAPRAIGLFAATDLDPLSDVRMTGYLPRSEGTRQVQMIWHSFESGYWFPGDSCPHEVFTHYCHLSSAATCRLQVALSRIRVGFGVVFTSEEHSPSSKSY